MMIFLTVGLHEQPFDRLIRQVDALPGFEKVIQTGFSTFEPQDGRWKSFMEFDEIAENMQKADVVVTHGGTGSIIMALSNGKRPIVAPRYRFFDEHVDDHQEEIVRELATRNLIIPLYRDDDLHVLIENLDRDTILPTNPGVRPLDRMIQSFIQGNGHE